MVRVCIVDDDEAIRETERMLLEDAGYEVVALAEGNAALELLKGSAEPLVVLFDYHTPRQRRRLLEMAELEAHLAERHAFICTTTNPGGLAPTLREVLVQFGVPIIAKPFDIDRLLEAVAQAVARVG